LHRLPNVAFQLVQAAAVLEGEIASATLQRTVHQQESEITDALDALLSANVLVERGDRYEFAHPLVAAVVRDDLSAARRRLLHASAAKALAETNRDQVAAVAGRLAFHYEQAGRTLEAAAHAEMAGARALSLAAPAEAVLLYRQAVRLDSTPERLMGLAEALHWQGHSAQARHLLRQALAAFTASDEITGAARACLALAETYLGSGSSHLLIEWAERAMQVGGTALGADFFAHVKFLLGAGNLRVERSLAVAESHLQEAVRLAVAHNLAWIEIQSRFELGNLFAERGDLAEAMSNYQQVITLAERERNAYQQVLGYNNLAYHAAVAGDIALARRAIEQGLTLADNHSLHMPRSYLYSSRGEVELAEGRPDEAQKWFQRALEEARKRGDNAQIANLQANLGRVAWAQGDLDQALSLLEVARQTVTGLTAQHLTAQIELWLAELHLSRGEDAAAAATLHRLAPLLKDSGRRQLLAAAQRLAGEIHSSFSPPAIRA
jgi:tetratricopeptide (TPR) repeat protein